MITGVSVEGLFGTFDHSVELNVQEGVTILAAPNGYGKSTLLRMIQSVGEAAFGDLAQVPFETFSVRDDQGPALVFSRRPVEENRTTGDADVERLLVFKGARTGSWSDTELVEPSPGHSRIELTVHREGREAKTVPLGVFPLSGADPHIMKDSAQVEAGSHHTASQFEFNQWVPTRGRSRWSEGPSSSFQELPVWLRRRLASMKVLLIESQRLLVPESEGHGSSHSGGPPASIPAVTAIRDDLVGRIRKAKIAYVERSGDIDRTFPTRFLKLAQSGKQRTESAPELRARLRELDEKRAQLQAVGILEREELPALEIPDDISEPYVQALSLLVGDIEDKLSHFDDLESRIALLKELANARFQFKTLEVDAERGLHCASGGRDIPLVQLSSGEQHELVLFYEALFQAEEGCLLMIDEPELSLHAAWQSEFIKDLKRILALSGGAVLIATHSSALIAGSWDLVVELTGPSSGLHS